MSISRTRTLWLLGLAALLGSAACDGGDGGGGPSGAFTVDWSLAYVGDTADQLGPATTCDAAGTPTVELTMFNRATKDRFVDSFSCKNTGGRSRALPPGDYDLTLDLKRADNKVVSNQVGTFTLGRSLTPVPSIVFPVQSFLLQWTLSRGTASLGCSDVDGKFVNLTTRLASDDAVTWSFPCAAGAGASPALELGTYAVGPIELVNSAGAPIWKTTDVPMTISVDENPRAVLPSVMFTFQ